MIKKTQKSVNLDGQTLWIADCATYTAENILELGTETLWITHAPETINEIKVLQNADLEMTPGKDPRYAFYVTELTHGGIPQRGVVVWSEEMQKRQEKTFDNMIQPTMRRVFQIFMGVTHTVLIEDGRVVKTIVHLIQEQVTILKLLGPEFEKCYGLQG
jgi:transposase